LLLLALACSHGSSNGGNTGGTGGSGALGGTGGAPAGGRGGAATGGGAGTGGAQPNTGGAMAGGTGGSAGGTGGARPDGGADATGAADAQAADAGADGPGAGARTFVYVGGNLTQEIRIFRLQAGGALEAAGMAPMVGMFPTYLAWDPQQRFLFASINNPAGKVVAHAIDAATGALRTLNEVASGGAGPAHLSVHGSGRWVFLAHYGSGHVSVVPVMTSGMLGPADTQMVGANAHMALADPSGRFVFVPCLGARYVAQFRFDAESGKLTPNDPPTVAPAVPADDPRHIAFHPSGRAAYVISESGSRMTSYDLDPATGRLSAPQALSTLPAGTSGSFGAHVLVHPNGKFVYGSNRGHNSLAIFAVAEGTRRLSFVAHETAGGTLRTPRGFGFDPSGRYLLLANQADPGFVTVFEVNATDGRLTRVGSTPAQRNAGFVGALAF
jgi:6-phosphogluconolactonase